MPYTSQETHKQSPLTPREIEVLALIATGMNNTQIENTLGIAKKTLNIFLGSIRLKTGLESRVMLAFYAYGKGYVSETEIKTAMQQERRKG